MPEADQIPSAVARKLVELTATHPPVHSFNRQFARLVIDALGAEAVTLWLLRGNELILCEQIEEQVGAVQRIAVSDERQQKVLRKVFENGEIALLSDAPEQFDPLRPPESSQRRLIFVPVMGVHGNMGVLRLVFRGVPEGMLSRLAQLAESLCGYYSLYSAHRILRTQHEQRQHFDRLGKAILQLQHDCFSDRLPEVVVNSAMEVASLDRAILLVCGRGDDLKVAAVSSVSSPNRKSAWSRLICELGRDALRTGEPVSFFSDASRAQEIKDPDLRERVNSYVLMTEVTSLLVYPLKSSGRNCGVLVLEKKGSRSLSSFEHSLCTVYASHAAVALANKRLVARLPLSGLLARRLEPADGQTMRGRRILGRVSKWALVLGLAVAFVWFVGFHPVPEKIGAKCFVQPAAVRIVTAKTPGEIASVYFGHGGYVEKNTLLLKLRTEDIELELGKERENLRNIQAQITKLMGETEQAVDAEERSDLLARARILQHSLMAKRQEVNLLESRLEDCSLFAPIAGTVLEPEDPEELFGVVVRAGEPLCRIGSIKDRVRVRIAVPAERAAEVQAGQEVEIRLRPLVDEMVLRGRVRRLAQRSVTYKNANVFMADVIMSNAPPARARGQGDSRHLLKDGMTGKAKIILPGESSYFAIYGAALYRKLKYWLF